VNARNSGQALNTSFTSCVITGSKRRQFSRIQVVSMKRILAAGLSALAFGWVLATPATADTRRDGASGNYGKHRYHKRYGTQVRGYVARRGGYSYIYADSINTYGDARSRYGSTLSFRDAGFERQSPGGPFDHGFFFDSGVAPRGGQSPYMH
jgi:hypothetical protein